MRALIKAPAFLLLAMATALSGLMSGAVPQAAPSASAAVGLAQAAGASGLSLTPVASGLRLPTAVQFASGGSFYVAEQSGIIKFFDKEGDTSPTTTLDITGVTYGGYDRGLLDFALDPKFDSGRPYLYALYTWDRDPSDTQNREPRWNDNCPNPPGANTDGCTATAKLVRFTVNLATGVADPASVKELLNGMQPNQGWCFQYTSHAIGALKFGPDNMLYVSAGDGASYDVVDWGQLGGSAGSPTAVNPCGDYDAPVGTAVSRNGIGGALRSQSVRTPASPKQTWDGAVLRIDPDTGAAAPGNPLAKNSRAIDDRIVAYGLRNPFRMNFRPGSNELWVGDVGWGTYEEVNKFTTGPNQTTVPNFGWPCYEGPSRQGGYDNAELGSCERLYSNGTSDLGGGVSSPLVSPYKAWPRANNQPAAGCSGGGGAVSGAAFAQNSLWPQALRGAFLFADYARSCIVALPIGANGEPNPDNPMLVANGLQPSDLEVGPGNDIFVTDIGGGVVYRIGNGQVNQPPNPSFTATPDQNNPLAYSFDGSATRDPNGETNLAYAWDLDGDGQCDDATGVKATHTYGQAGPVDVTLCVTDSGGAVGRVTKKVPVGDRPPANLTLTSSLGGGKWTVGQNITLTADATDEQALPESAFTWDIKLMHCPEVPADPNQTDGCHEHSAGNVPAGRTATIAAPDHDYYAFLRANLTVTDSVGLTAKKSLDMAPQLANMEVRTNIPGVQVTVGGDSGASPFTQPALVGGKTQLVVPRYTTSNGKAYEFAGWADGNTAGTARDVTTPAAGGSYLANYKEASPLSRSGWTASTSTWEPYELNGEAKNAIDGNLNTVWQTRSWDPLPQTFTLDLGSETAIGALEYTPRQDAGAKGLITSYRIEASANGQNWTPIQSGSFDGTSRVQIANLPPTKTRWLRLVVTGAAAGQNIGAAAEINLFPPNVSALPRAGWVATADSAEMQAERNPAGNVLDGNTSTMWHTDWAGTSPMPHELTLDLGAPQTLGALEYTPRRDGSSNGDITRYQILVSNNGIDWGSPITSGTLDGSKRIQTIVLPTVTTRWVRLRALASVDGRGFASAAEINLYPPTVQPLASNGWTVTADSEETSGENGRASNVIDGNFATIWHSRYLPSATQLPHWLSFDLGSAKSIGSIEYTPRQDAETNGVITGMEMQVSADGNTWKTYATGAFNGSKSTQRFNLPTVDTRWVRLRATGSVSGPWSTAAEVKLYPPTVQTALSKSGWKATTDSQEVDRESAPVQNAIDGVPGTFWHTKWSPSPDPMPHWITLDLGAPTAIGSLEYTSRRLAGFNGNIGNYDVYVSSDGVNWGQPIKSGSFVNTLKSQRADLPATTTRYLKLQVKSSVGGVGFTAVGELDLYPPGS